MPEDLGTRVVRGGLALATRSAVGALLSAASLLVFIRRLGATEYGAFAAALGLILLILNLGQCGIAVSLVRRRETVTDTGLLDSAFTILVVFGVGGALVLWVLAAVLPVFVQAHSAASTLRLMALALPVALASQVPAGILDQRLEFRAVALSELAGQSAYVICGTLLTWWNPSAGSLGAAWATQQLVLTLVLFYHSDYIPKHLSIRPAIPLVMDGLRYTTSLSVWQLRTAIPSLIIAPMAGFGVVAQLAVANRIIEVAGSMRSVVWRLSLAGLSHVQDDPAVLRRTVTTAMHLQVVAYGCLLVFGALLASIAPGILGSEWTTVNAVYPFLAIAALANAAFSTHSAVLYSMRHDLSVGCFHCAHFVILVVATVAFLPAYGLMGYGASEIVALSSYAMLALFVRKEIGAVQYGDAAIAFVSISSALVLMPLGPVALVPIVALAARQSTRSLTLSVGRRLAYAVKATV